MLGVSGAPAGRVRVHKPGKPCLQTTGCASSRYPRLVTKEIVETARENIVIGPP